MMIGLGPFKEEFTCTGLWVMHIHKINSILCIACCVVNGTGQILLIQEYETPQLSSLQWSLMNEAAAKGNLHCYFYSTSFVKLWSAPSPPDTS